MTTGVDLVQAAPQDFLAHPGNWMQWISDYRGTATAGPNFSWVLAHPGAASAMQRSRPVDAHAGAVGRRAGRSRRGRGVRGRGVSRSGSRPAACSRRSGWPRWRSAARSRPAARGLRVRHRSTAYVLETRARRQAGRGQRSPTSSTRHVPAASRCSARRCPAWRCGSSIPTRTSRLPERHVGELLLRGTSVTPGYYKRPDATAALFHDGWLCTGDLAYLLDGELVLCGRIKDVIIVGGRNVFPEDIERAVGRARRRARRQRDRLRHGGLQGQGERGRRGRGSRRRLVERPSTRSAAIHHRTLEVCGIPPRDVMLVQPGTLPKTSSGKLQRAKCREQYLAEDLALV